MRHLARTGRRRWGPVPAALLVAVALLLPLGSARAVDPTANQEQKSTSVLSAQVAPQVTTQVQRTVEEKRAWFFDALFETHWKVIRDNLASNDVYHLLYLRGNYDLPGVGPIKSLGRVSLRAELTRSYVADPGESGFLFGDLRLYYSHPFSFSIKGQEFDGRGYLYWTFPTSKVSEQESNISRPTVILALSKELPFGLTLFTRPYARITWSKYAQKQGGNPNDKWILGYDLMAVYTLPLIHPKLRFLKDRASIGAGWTQDWISKYSSIEGEDQPWTSEYYWEVFAGYSVFQKPVGLDAYLTLSSGRRTVEDGVWRFHWVDRDETELYLTLMARY